MDYAAFVPFKSNGWHTRLSDVLNPEQRRKLALCEVSHVISIISKYADLYIGLQRGGLSEKVLRVLLYLIGGLENFQVMPINDVKDGIEEFYKITKGYKGVIICGSDLPLLTTEDIEYVLSLLDGRNVVFSSAIDGGTPFYFIQPSGIYIPQLYLDDGNTNTERQIQRLNNQCLSYGIITDRPGLCRDLDNLSDIYYFLNSGCNSLPIRYLRQLLEREVITFQNFS